MIIGASSLEQLQNNLSMIKKLKEIDQDNLKQIESILKNKPKQESIHKYWQRESLAKHS